MAKTNVLQYAYKAKCNKCRPVYVLMQNWNMHNDDKCLIKLANSHRLT